VIVEPLPVIRPVVLIVCRGNVCRSPLAASYLRSVLPAHLDDQVLVASAGVGALVGQGVDPTTARLGERVGLDLRQHRARQLESSMVELSNIVLTTSRHQGGIIQQQNPTAHGRVFTIRQLARLTLGHEAEYIKDSDEPMRDWLDRLALTAARCRHFEPRSADDDIVDPFRRRSGIHRLAFKQIQGAIDQLATLAIGPVGFVPRPLVTASAGEGQ